MASKREIVESPIEQGKDERIAYTLTTTPWGGSPSSVSCTLYKISPNGALTDVSGTNLTGSASTSTDDIISPTVISLTAGSNYRLEFKFVSGGKTLEPYLIIVAKN
jgi:hypothetical protein